MISLETLDRSHEALLVVGGSGSGSHCSARCLLLVAVVSVESREAHLSSLVLEAERRAADLAAQAQRDGLSLEACHKDKQLRAWEWRSKLYKRMRTGFQHARESL